jgi:asparagine synthase (glutamine-hydrolysing)
MCGINGFNFNDRELIDRMNAATAHRGPDGTGVFSDTTVTLGHNLLAITETPELSQGPYSTEDGKFVLAYNGEIYNYLALRERLESVGESFQTQSDTEVLLKGLRHFGIDFVRDLDGMFAFAFYDRDRQRLYVVRDPSGMKPVYFSFNNGRFTFSSEVR